MGGERWPRSVYGPAIGSANLVCNTFGVTVRTPFLVALCAVFLAGRVFGLHSHLSHEGHHEGVGHVSHPNIDHDVDHDHDHDDGRGHEVAGQGEHITLPSMEGAAGHLESHLLDGDVDLDSPAASSGKASLLTGLMLAVELDSTPLLIVPVRESPVFPPPSRPPKPGSRPYLHPPSQAPPRAALNG